MLMKQLKGLCFVFITMSVAFLLRVTPIFAADIPKVGIDSAVITSAVSTAVNNTLQMMSSLLPIALSVFAATWGVRKAIRFFKGAAN